MIKDIRQPVCGVIEEAPFVRLETLTFVAVYNVEQATLKSHGSAYT
jgi:hypothetical protein